MAIVPLTPEQIARAGTIPTRTGTLLTTNTYTFPNDGRVIVQMQKAGAGACTVTITTPNTVDGFAIPDRTVVVAATTGDVFIGPFPVKDYNDAAGLVTLTFSEITGLTIAVLRV
jgi:hypothetical protein